MQEPTVNIYDEGVIAADAAPTTDQIVAYSRHSSTRFDGAPDDLAGGGDVDMEDQPYDVFLIAGQSNAVGYGADGDYWTDFDAAVDGAPQEDIKQWGRFGTDANTVIAAVDTTTTACATPPSTLLQVQAGRARSGLASPLARPTAAPIDETCCWCPAPREGGRSRRLPRAERCTQTWVREHRPP